VFARIFNLLSRDRRNNYWSGTLATATRGKCSAPLSMGWTRAADWLTGGGIAVALLSPFAAYLPWPFGVWTDVEPTIILLHTGALICSAGLGAAWLTGRRDPVGALRHPLVLICLAIAAWSIAAAPFSRFPILSIIGSPQIADGAVLWLDIAVFIAGTRMMRDSGAGLAQIGGVTAFAAIVLPALALFPATRAIWFNDYLAFLGLAAAVVVPACLRHRIQSNKMLIILAILSGAPAIVVYQNYTAIVLIMGLSGPAYLAVRALQHRHAARWARPARTASAVLIGAVALALPVNCGRRHARRLYRRRRGGMGNADNSILRPDARRYNHLATRHSGSNAEPALPCTALSIPDTARPCGMQSGLLDIASLRTRNRRRAERCDRTGETPHAGAQDRLVRLFRRRRPGDSGRRWTQ
jgi:hypothetical protein